MSNIVTAHSACIEDFIELLGLQDKKICELSFSIGVDQIMVMQTKEFVSEEVFDQVVDILRKYRVTEIPQEESNSDKA